MEVILNDEFVLVFHHEGWFQIDGLVQDYSNFNEAMELL